MKFTILFMLWFMGYLVPSPTTQNTPANIHLNISEDKSHTVFEVACRNLTSDSINLTYEFLIQKKGHSGTSSNRQGGQVGLASHEEKVCATTRLNLSPGDSCAIELTLYQGKTLIDKENKLFIAK